MPALCSNWPSSKPEGPAPMMAIWVFSVFIVLLTRKFHATTAGELFLWIECLHFSLASLSIEGEN
ncbi:hypothetical protein D3C71_2217860 [compost metagenome]